VNADKKILKQHSTGLQIVLEKKPALLIKIVDADGVEITLGGDSQVVNNLGYDIGCAATRLKRFGNGC